MYNNIRFFSLQKLREEEIVLNKILSLYMYSCPDSPLGKLHLFILCVFDYIFAHNFLYCVLLQLVVWVRQVNKKVDKQVFFLCFVVLIYSGHALSYTSIEGAQSRFAHSEKFSLIFFQLPRL